eukprot:tig00001073_g6815.t1
MQTSIVLVALDCSALPPNSAALAAAVEVAIADSAAAASASTSGAAAGVLLRGVELCNCRALSEALRGLAPPRVAFALLADAPLPESLLAAGCGACVETLELTPVPDGPAVARRAARRALLRAALDAYPDLNQVLVLERVPSLDLVHPGAYRRLAAFCHPRGAPLCVAPGPLPRLLEFRLPEPPGASAAALVTSPALRGLEAALAAPRGSRAGPAPRLAWRLWLEGLAAACARPGGGHGLAPPTAAAAAAVFRALAESLGEESEEGQEGEGVEAAAVEAALGPLDAAPPPPRGPEAESLAVRAELASGTCEAGAGAGILAALRALRAAALLEQARSRLSSARRPAPLTRATRRPRRPASTRALRGRGEGAGAGRLRVWLVDRMALQDASGAVRLHAACGPVEGRGGAGEWSSSCGGTRRAPRRRRRTARRERSSAAAPPRPSPSRSRPPPASETLHAQRGAAAGGDGRGDGARRRGGGLVRRAGGPRRRPARPRPGPLSAAARRACLRRLFEGASALRAAAAAFEAAARGPDGDPPHASPAHACEALVRRPLPCSAPGSLPDELRRRQARRACWRGEDAAALRCVAAALAAAAARFGPPPPCPRPASSPPLARLSGAQGRRCPAGLFLASARRALRDAALDEAAAAAARGAPLPLPSPDAATVLLELSGLREEDAQACPRPPRPLLQPPAGRVRRRGRQGVFGVAKHRVGAAVFARLRDRPVRPWEDDEEEGGGGREGECSGGVARAASACGPHAIPAGSTSVPLHGRPDRGPRGGGPRPLAMASVWGGRLARAALHQAPLLLHLALSRALGASCGGAGGPVQSLAPSPAASRDAAAAAAAGTGALPAPLPAGLYATLAAAAGLAQARPRASSRRRALQGALAALALLALALGAATAAALASPSAGALAACRAFALGACLVLHAALLSGRAPGAPPWRSLEGLAALLSLAAPALLFLPAALAPTGPWAVDWVLAAAPAASALLAALALGGLLLWRARRFDDLRVTPPALLEQWRAERLAGDENVEPRGAFAAHVRRLAAAPLPRRLLRGLRPGAAAGPGEAEARRRAGCLAAERELLGPGCGRLPEPLSGAWDAALAEARAALLLRRPLDAPPQALAELAARRRTDGALARGALLWDEGAPGAARAALLAIALLLLANPAARLLEHFSDAWAGPAPAPSHQSASASLLLCLAALAVACGLFDRPRARELLGALLPPSLSAPNAESCGLGAMEGAGEPQPRVAAALLRPEAWPEREGSEPAELDAPAASLLAPASPALLRAAAALLRTAAASSRGGGAGPPALLCPRPALPPLALALLLAPPPRLVLAAPRGRPRAAARRLAEAAAYLSHAAAGWPRRPPSPPRPSAAAARAGSPGALPGGTAALAPVPGLGVSWRWAEAPAPARAAALLLAAGRPAAALPPRCLAALAATLRLPAPSLPAVAAACRAGAALLAPSPRPRRPPPPPHATRPLAAAAGRARPGRPRPPLVPPPLRRPRLPLGVRRHVPRPRRRDPDEAPPRLLRALLPRPLAFPSTPASSGPSPPASPAPSGAWGPAGPGGACGAGAAGPAGDVPPRGPGGGGPEGGAGGALGRLGRFDVRRAVRYDAASERPLETSFFSFAAAAGPFPAERRDYLGDVSNEAEASAPPRLWLLFDAATGRALRGSVTLEHGPDVRFDYEYDGEGPGAPTCPQAARLAVLQPASPARVVFRGVPLPEPLEGRRASDVVVRLHAAAGPGRAAARPASAELPGLLALRYSHARPGCPRPSCSPRPAPAWLPALLARCSPSRGAGGPLAWEPLAASGALFGELGPRAGPPRRRPPTPSAPTPPPRPARVAPAPPPHPPQLTRQPQARAAVWRAWQDSRLDGPAARRWDEELLRADPAMAPTGPSVTGPRRRGPRLAPAARPGPGARISLAAPSEARPSTRQGLPAARADAAAQGRPLPAVALDCATWPMDGEPGGPGRAAGAEAAAGGGVAACRRDLLARLPRIAWTAVAEVANEARSSRVEALRVVATLDRLTSGRAARGRAGVAPCRAAGAAAEHAAAAFVPSSPASSASGPRPRPRRRWQREQLAAAGRLWLDLRRYFAAHDYAATRAAPSPPRRRLPRADGRAPRRQVEHAAVRRAFRRHFAGPAAGGPGLPDGPSEGECEVRRRLGRSEGPADTAQAVLGLVAHYLRGLACPPPRPAPSSPTPPTTPRRPPRRRPQGRHGASFLVWDHAIAYREALRLLSHQRALSPWVRGALAGFARLAARAAYACADCVVACTPAFNPAWEAYLAGDADTGSQRTADARRRLSPVANGVEACRPPRPALPASPADACLTLVDQLSRFSAARGAEEARPTAIMLSHLNPLKDVLTAIRAAKLIVEGYGLADYQLLVYGDPSKDPPYAAQCQRAVEQLGLSRHVLLCGQGRASEALRRGWLFVNSSRSEGLPLALAEAALAALPVVCTDVGGSPALLSAAPAPGEAGSMSPRAASCVPASEGARRRRWSPRLRPPGAAPAALAARVAQAGPLRRALGLRLRAAVAASYGIDRYVREHEQQLWLFAMRAAARRAVATTGPALHFSSAVAAFVSPGRVNGGSETVDSKAGA